MPRTKCCWSATAAHSSDLGAAAPDGWLLPALRPWAIGRVNMCNGANDEKTPKEEKCVRAQGMFCQTSPR
jgi:hypothetical protein